MKKQPASFLDPPPRPPCGCGKPADHEVSLVIRTLELQSRYWTAPYQAVVTELRSMVCSDCLRKNITIQFTANASLAKASKGSSGDPVS